MLEKPENIKALAEEAYKLANLPMPAHICQAYLKIAQALNFILACQSKKEGA